MADLILIAVIAVVVGIAVKYIIKQKKKGVKCIGCPNSGTCASAHGEHQKCNGSCGRH